MLVYRVGRTKHANDLSGEGAKIYGGRWNHKSVPCLYTSESRALALLEYTVNINIEDIPRALSITAIEIPADEIFIVNEALLPGNWKEVPAPFSTKEFGTHLIQTSKKSIIKIPSSVITEEYNYIINPIGIKSKGLKIVEIRDLIYDVRIKLV
jgi:RES domain-containing protein